MILQLVLVALLAPLLTGVIRKTKALVAGRSGPPLLQLYFDIAKLLRKRTVLSETTTWVFLLGPAAAVAVPLLASIFVPITTRTPLAFTGDLILFVYLFALSRFCTTTSALDTGSAFEGMGAAREVTFSALAEPALFFGLLALARISGSLSLASALSIGGAAWQRASAALVLIVASWFVVLLAENSRVPFDDPTTHLELTMVHEVMVLDHGGPAFALIQYGAALKLFVYGALVVAIMMPHGVAPFATVPAVLLLGVAIGLVESGMARLRLVRIPQLLVTASLAAAFAVVLVVR